MAERVQKILSQWGIASRRHAESLISEGRVTVNGRVAQLGDRVDPQRDRLEVDRKPVRPGDRPPPIYLLLHKPAGVVSSCSDPQHRKTVLDLLPKELAANRGLHPVGRLDIDSTGALLLTNDGDLTLRLTHPRYHLPKTYDVAVRGNPSDADLDRWRQGVMLEGKNTLPAEVRVLKHWPDRTLLRVVLTEGRNRQIRRVASLLGFDVLKLHRIAIGSIRLQSGGGDVLAKGCYRPLRPSEVAYLKRHTRLDLELSHAPRSHV